MSSTTADSYPESVGSCRPTTPPAPAPPPPPPVPAAPAPAPRGAPVPVRRQLDFDDADLEDIDDFVIRAVDDIERGYSEAKRRAPPCVCGRGECAVRRDEQSGRWMYVCSSQPKCKHFALCEEVGLSPESQPAVRSRPKTSNPWVFDSPSNLAAEPRTPINNVNIRGAGDRTPINVSSQAAVPKTPVYSTFQGAGTTTPVHASPQGARATTVVKISPRGARSNDEWPICQCTAGKCKKVKVNGKDCYVCPIPKGQGACSHNVPVHAVANELLQTGDNHTRRDKDLKDKPAAKEAHGNNNLFQVEDNNACRSANPAQDEDNQWPFDIVNGDVVPTALATPHSGGCQGSPSMLRQPTAMVRTPAKSPVPPYNTRSPMTPCSDDICYRCGEKGHWFRNCPKPSPGVGR